MGFHGHVALFIIMRDEKAHEAAQAEAALAEAWPIPYGSHYSLHFEGEVQRISEQNEALRPD